MIWKKKQKISKKKFLILSFFSTQQLATEQINAIFFIWTHKLIKFRIRYYFSSSQTEVLASLLSQMVISLFAFFCYEWNSTVYFDGDIYKFRK